MCALRLLKQKFVTQFSGSFCAAIYAPSDIYNCNIERVYKQCISSTWCHRCHRKHISRLPPPQLCSSRKIISIIRIRDRWDPRGETNSIQWANLILWLCLLFDAFLECKKARAQQKVSHSRKCHMSLYHSWFKRSKGKIFSLFNLKVPYHGIQRSTPSLLTPLLASPTGHAAGYASRRGRMHRGNPLVRDCSCRGYSGYAHLSWSSDGQRAKANSSTRGRGVRLAWTPSRCVPIANNVSK